MAELHLKAGDECDRGSLESRYCTDSTRGDPGISVDVISRDAYGGTKGSVVRGPEKEKAQNLSAALALSQAKAQRPDDNYTYTNVNFLFLHF